eukprot:jgi/Ulvmu1/232/UM001_0236.1
MVCAKGCWVFRSISWYSIVLTVVFAFASAKLLGHVLAVNNAFDSLVSQSAVQISASETSEWITWVFRITCVLVLATTAGALWNVGNRVYYDSVKQSFMSGALLNNTRCCSGVPVSRLLVNVNHAVAVASTAWFGALLFGASALTYSFRTAEIICRTAASLQLVDQASTSFFKDTRSWLASVEDELGGILGDVDTYCGRVQCGATITSSGDALQDLQEEFNVLAVSMAPVGAGLCPTAACANAGLFVFPGTSATGCICDPAAVASIHADASGGLKSCQAAVIWAAAAFGAALLLMSAAAMSLKSLVKDQHWMYRFNMLAGELTARGLTPQNSMYNLLDEGSLSHYPIRQPPMVPVPVAFEVAQDAPACSKNRHTYKDAGAPDKPTGMLARESLDAENSGEGSLKAIGGQSDRWGNTWDAPSSRGSTGVSGPTVVPVPPPRV